MSTRKPLSFPDDETLAAALVASRVLDDAPPQVIERAIGLWEPRARSAAASRRGLVRRLAAALTFDSGNASPLAWGMRSSGSAVRQLLYSVEGRDIDLRIAPTDTGRYTLSGQVLGPDVLGVVVLEPVGGGERAETALSELGEFRLPAVAAGDYRITLELADTAIDLPPLHVPQAA
jgi:hypothetical protein